MAYQQFGNPMYGYQQPFYPQPPQDQLGYLRSQQQPQQQAQPSNPLWVQGEAGAKAFPVAPGSSVVLMDSESDVFYIKSADQSGMPMMRTFDYTERVAQNTPVQAAMPAQAEFVTRAEFDALRQQITALTQLAPVTITKEEK